MEVNSFTLEPGQWLGLIGDSHFGNVVAHKELFIECHEWIKKEKGKIIGMGDIWEAIIPGDKRYRPAQIDPDFYEDFATNEISRAIERVTDWMMPYEKQYVGVMAGNHEETLTKILQWKADEFSRSIGREYLRAMELFKEADVTKMFAYRLKCNYLGMTCEHTITCGNNKIKMVTCHANTQHRMKQSILGYLEKRLSVFPDALVYAHGHYHQLLSVEKIELVTHYGKPKDKERLGLTTGAFFRTYMPGVITYGEQRGYDPVKLGTVAIRFDEHGKVERREMS